MLSPNPISLLCALLLCLPLAVIFTVKTPTTAPAFIPSNSTALHHLSRPPPPPPKINITRVHKQLLNKNNTRIPPNVTVWDDDDNSLSQLAARVNPYPTPGVHKKIAFMFLTNTPLPLAPLWELYFNQTPTHFYNIYIHADPSSLYDSPFRGVFAHRVIPSKHTRRHSPTLVAAARRLLSHALLHDSSNYMFALLSPSCIPLHSFNFTYNTLTQSNRSFIEVLKNEGGAYDRWAARGNLTMLPEVPVEKFRIGSQFFVLTRQHARIVSSDSKLWSKFKLPCVTHHTCYPEEHYFPTLMSMVDPLGCVPSTLTHVDWRGCHDGHPRTYSLTDVGPELIWTFRNATPRYGDDGTNGSDVSVSRQSHQPPFLFARKFAPETITPLLEIANDVIFKD